ncbi:hypothetical protein [Nocardia alni]|uniref:hypothetical protein n=1 Tax=Nocardia alni TaxID=2815723 RepID=UPI001C24ABB9|nr:hypothetical protein [Nocardia alni]
MSRFVPMRVRRALSRVVIAFAVVTAPLTVVAAPAFAAPVVSVPASPSRPAVQPIQQARGWMAPHWHNPGMSGFGRWHEPGFGGWRGHRFGGWRFPGMGGWRFPEFGGGNFQGFGGWRMPWLGWMFPGWGY